MGLMIRLILWQNKMLLLTQLIRNKGHRFYRLADESVTLFSPNNSLSISSKVLSEEEKKISLASALSNKQIDQQQYIAEHPGEFITPLKYSFESFNVRNLCNKML